MTVIHTKCYNFNGKCILVPVRKLPENIWMKKKHNSQTLQNHSITDSCSSSLQKMNLKCLFQAVAIKSYQFALSKQFKASGFAIFTLWRIGFALQNNLYKFVGKETTTKCNAPGKNCAINQRSRNCAVLPSTVFYYHMIFTAFQDVFRYEWSFVSVYDWTHFCNKVEWATWGKWWRCSWLVSQLYRFLPWCPQALR